jgi:isoleucyl-tRNA synthetase
MAPILSFTAEEIWQTMPARPGKGESVFFETFVATAPPVGAADLLSRWERLIEVRRLVNKALESARGEIGKSLEAAVTITADAATAPFSRASARAQGVSSSSRPSK